MEESSCFLYETKYNRGVIACKYKLKPSKKMIAIFESWLLALCELYNAALQERRDAYRMAGISISKSDQEKQLPEIKQENPRLARIHSQVIQEALKRVDLAFQHFFRRVREGQVPGFPRFQVEVVNANGTSTTSSRCGHKCRMPMYVRVYRCGKCGLIIDRDHNSSLNIEGRKGRIVPSGRRRVAVVKEPRTYRSIVSDVAPQS